MRVRTARSSASSTRCASFWRFRTTAMPMTVATGSQTHPPRSSRLPSLSTSFATVARRAHVPLLRCHLPSDHPRPVMLRHPPRLCSPPSLTTWLSSLHTRNYSIPMVMQGTMILFLCRFTRPLKTHPRRRRMSARMDTRLAKICVSSKALHPRIPISFDLLLACCCNVFVFPIYIPSSLPTTYM